MTRSPSFPVSIIIPFLNAAPYLTKTIESVLAQTFPDWELVLFDDGSVDDSTAIALGYSLELPEKIKYFEHIGHLNLGPFATRVEGARRCRSQLIALLDADDIWAEDYLERHVTWWLGLRDRNVPLSYGPVLFWHDQNCSAKTDFVQALPAGVPRIFDPGELLEAFLTSNYLYTPYPSATLLKTRLLLEVARYTSVARQCLAYEDQILWWYTAVNYPIAIHDRCLVKYRWQNPRSAVMSMEANPDRAALAQRNFLRVIYAHLQSCDSSHPLVTNGTLRRRIADLELQAGIGDSCNYGS